MMAAEEPPANNLPALDTLCAHWAEDPARFHGAVIPPIFQNSLFTFPDCETRDRLWAGRTQTGVEGADALFEYTRVSNPTTAIVEAKIAVLERGEQARCFSSGMAAISAAVLSCVRTGDHVIAPETVYGPTRVLLSEYLPRFHIETTYVDGRDPEDFVRALRPNTRLIYLESPSTGVFYQQDLQAVAALARSQGIATICDNSWASPCFQNPIPLGIDLVVHSATKYLGGHSDVIAGVVVGPASRMEDLSAREGCLLGAVLDPFAAWLLLRGVRTLSVRMERHQRNALQVATFLNAHPAIARVFYPGLPDAPQAALSARQLRGFSSFSVALRDPGQAAAYRFVNRLRYFGIGCSWGGFESLAMPMQ
ncbi:MAG: PLP-dependent aspartate aminotransferase family protein, partial [Chloroherpetonaceae bacterium]|nr:PLP-dependent aspartate aminotransferase family protein [Chloroherpetonaceae bacterium]